MKRQLMTALALMAIAPSVLATPVVSSPFPGQINSVAGSQDEYLAFRTTLDGNDEKVGIIASDQLYINPKTAMNLDAELNQTPIALAEQCEDYDYNRMNYKDDLRWYDKKLRNLRRDIADLEDDGADENDPEVVKLQKRKKRYEQEKKDMVAKFKKEQASPGLKIGGTWSSGYAEAVQSFFNANPHLQGQITVRKVPTVIDEIHYGSIQNSTDTALFNTLRINNQDFVAGQNAATSYIPNRSKLSLDQDYVQKIIDSKKYEDLSLHQAVTGASNRTTLGQSADNGLWAGVLTLGASCNMLKNMESDDNGDVKTKLDMTIHSMYPTAVNLHVKAKYNLKEMYEYFEKNSEGMDGLNILKRKKVQDIKEQIKQEGKFSFTYLCDDQTGSICQDEMKVKDKAMDFLLNQALQMFTMELPADFDKEKLGMPNNPLSSAAESVATAVYGPAVGRAVKAVADVFSSTETEQHIKRTIDRQVEEVWNITKIVWLPTSRNVTFRFK